MKPSICSYIRHFAGSLLMPAILMLCLVCGCVHKPDPRLAHIDSIIESRPDSALSLLDAYCLSKESSSADSVYYAMLLTHARYKNFIDETDDGLISRSADYYIEHGDKENAARSLFLQGMIHYNAGRLGEAAVSFTKGLDLAQESKSYMWEGQCARGLFMLYSELHAGSAQVNFARQAYDAFMKLDDEEWMKHSMLELAVAYNNNCNYDKALSLLNILETKMLSVTDTVFHSNLYGLKGLSLFALGQYTESLDYYGKALDLLPSVLSDADLRNIQVALSELRKYSEDIGLYETLENLNMGRASAEAFVVYANEGRYKEAYESLDVYRNRQDSVFSVIFRNNVAESVDQYRNLRTALLKEKNKKERMFYWLLILGMVLVGILVLWRVRERMHRAEARRLKVEADMESLRSDLLSQLERFEKEDDSTVKPIAIQKVTDFETIIQQRYAEVNRLCDDYYQESGIKKDRNDCIHEKISSIVKSFTEKDSLEKIADYIDATSGGLYSSFKNDFYFLPEDSHRMFLYLMIGLSARTLSVIGGHSINAVYNKKSRLKAKIEQSDVADKSEYLRFF